MLDPPAAAESTQNQATETIKTKKCVPATTEAIQKQRRKPYKSVSCDDGNHNKQNTKQQKQNNKNKNKNTTETITQQHKLLDVFDDGIHKTTS